MRYRLDIGYLGTQFQGWQQQPNWATLQDCLETALTTLLREPIKLTAASRTDAGVHAEHQVLCFSASAQLDAFRLFRGLEALCPHDIWFRSLTQVPDTFHPIKDSLGKVYRYRLWRSSGPHGMLRPYVWHFPQPLDLDRMRHEASQLVGRHNFRSFCAADSGAKTYEREIFSVKIEEKGALVNIWIFGDGFLKQMVRNLVGSLVDIAKSGSKMPPIKSLLLAKDRRQAGICAPASGLSLVRVVYGEPIRLDELILRANSGFSFEL